MSLKSAMSNIGTSLTGSVKKAVLLLHQLQTTNTGSLMGAGKLSSVTKNVLTSAASIGGSAFSTAANALAGGGGALEVQYNPSSLSLTANAQPVPFSYLLKNTDNGIPNQDLRPPSVTLNVQLVFDDMNVKDAFMAEKARLSVGDVISDVSAIVTAARGKSYSVQPQTNALVAMLMRESTRLVTFQWADMSFTGEVCQTQARYTMFSVSGQPIRSVVDLVIVQAITGSGDMTQWDNAFDKGFANSLSASTTGKSTIQKASNLINISGF